MLVDNNVVAVAEVQIYVLSKRLKYSKNGILFGPGKASNAGVATSDWNEPKLTSTILDP